MSTSFDVTSLFDRRNDRRWNRMVVGDVLERLTWSRPDAVALTGRPGAFSDARFERMTYRAADRAANQIAHALLSHGLERGDRVLLYCDNSVEAILTLFGVAKAGLVAVPVNPLLAPDVLRWVVERVEPAFAVVDAEFLGRAAPILAAGGVPEPVTLHLGGEAVELPFGEWIAGRPDGEVDVDLHADDVWSLVFTSGTTAMPKGSMATHTYSYLTAHSYALSLTRGLAYEDQLRLCTFLPIVYHCGHNSAVLPAFVAGGGVVLGRRPDAAALADAITAEGVTALWAGSPRWLEKLAEQRETRPDEIDLGSLTVAMYSWGAMTPGTHERLRRACDGDVKLLEVFGQTESMSCFRFWPDRAGPHSAATGTNEVGVPNPMLAADIVDSTGASLRGRPGVAGEAVYRSPAITAGYYRDPEQTAEAFRGGWFHSGDSCEYTADGSQVMVDRFKDIVKSGGENVSSLRVEMALAEHPGVDRVAVIGTPHRTWGEVVTAIVESAGTVSEEELLVFARGRLAGYEAPKRIVFVDRMPETVGGKILKYRLREQFGAAPDGPDT